MRRKKCMVLLYGVPGCAVVGLMSEATRDQREELFAKVPLCHAAVLSMVEHCEYAVLFFVCVSRLLSLIVLLIAINSSRVGFKRWFVFAVFDRGVVACVPFFFTGGYGMV